MPTTASKAGLAAEITALIEELDEEGLAVVGDALVTERKRREQPYGPDDYGIGTVLSFTVNHGKWPKQAPYTYAVVKADNLVWYTTAGVVVPGGLPKRVTWDELTAWCAERNVPAFYRADRFRTIYRRGSSAS